VSALAAGASTASAVILHLRNGTAISYELLRGTAAITRVAPLDEFFHNVDYNGGPR
jgi:hypothetical protein